MTVVEIKEQLHKAIDQSSESVLEELFEYWQKLHSDIEARTKRSNNFKRMLEEDKDLLQKLAE